MKRQNTLKIVFLSLLISTCSTSCGLIEKFKNPEQATDSKDGVVETMDIDASAYISIKTGNSYIFKRSKFVW